MSTFTDQDRKLFRATAILASAVAFASLVILVFWILARVLSHFHSLLLPLAIAAVMALVLDPLIKILTRNLRIKRLTAVIILASVLVAGIIGLHFVVVPIAIEQFDELRTTVPTLVNSARDTVDYRLPGLSDQITERIEEIEVEEIADQAEALLSQIGDYAGLLVGLSFTPLFLFFMLTSSNRITSAGRELLTVFNSERQEEILFLTKLFINYVTAFFQGQLVIALLMGILLAVGFTLIGLQGAIAFGLVLGILNIVPFLGVLIGLLLVIPVAGLQADGGLQLIGLVILVFIIVQLIESWLLTPKIMSEKSGLHPAVVVISLFFWGIVFGGIIGLLLAVPLSAFLLALWKYAKKRYLSPVIVEEGGSDSRMSTGP